MAEIPELFAGDNLIEDEDLEIVPGAKLPELFAGQSLAPVEIIPPALTRNAVGAAGSSSSQAASDKTLSEEVNVPSAAVSDATRESLRRQAVQQRVEKTETPVLRELFAGDDLLTNLSQDDIPNLTEAEHGAQELGFFAQVSGPGIDRLQATGFRFFDFLGEVTGAEALEEFGQKGAIREFGNIARTGGQIQVVDIDTIEDFIKWMKSLGSDLPSMAPSLVAGIAGAKIGAVAGTAIAPGPGTAIGTIIGSLLGAFIPSFVLQIGEGQQAVKQRGGEEAQAPGAVVVAGVLNALLDSVLAGRLGSKLTKAFGLDLGERVIRLGTAKIIKRTVIEGAKGAGIEGITESFQTAITEVAAATGTGTEIDAKEFAEEIVESFARGAILGGGITSTVSVVSDVQMARKRKVQLDNLRQLRKTSKLAALAPDKAADVGTAQLEAAGVTEVFVPADVLLQYVSQQPDPAAAIRDLGLSDTLDVDLLASTTGEASVAIPISSFSENVLNSDGYDLLASHTKFSKDQKTSTESAEALQEHITNEETEKVLTTELEAYNASEELKQRVEALVTEVKGDNPTKALEDADVTARIVLDDLLRRVQERTTDVSAVVREGRVAQLEEEISAIDKDIAAADEEIETREAEGKATKRLENRAEKLTEQRDKRVEEQTKLASEELVVGVGKEVQAEQAKKVRLKKIKTKAKVLQDLGVKITKEAVQATRAAFKAGLKAGENLTTQKKAAQKLINGTELTGIQKNQLNNRISNAKTEAQLKKVMAAVQSRATVFIERNRKAQIRAAIKRTLKNSKPKKLQGKLVGTDADVELMLAKAREIMSLSPGAAKERLEAVLRADPFLEPISAFERQLISIAANDPNLNSVDAENILIDLAQLLKEGEAAAANRILAKRNAILQDVKEYKEATTQGEPVAELKTTGFFALLKAKGQDIRVSLASMHNAWDEILDITINKKGVEASRLIKNLRMTQVVQLFKGRILKWEQELIEIGVKAFQLEGHAQLMDRHSEDARRIDFGKFENARAKKARKDFADGEISKAELNRSLKENTVRLEYSKAEIRKLWMERQDPTLHQVIQHEQGNAFTDDMLRTMFANLEQTDYDYAQVQLDFYKKLYPQVNAVYRKIYGIDLPFNEFYSPIQRDKGSVAPEGSVDSFGADRIVADEMTFRRSLPRNLKTREANVVPLLRRSDVGAMHRYMRDMAWFIETTEKVLHIKGVYDSQSLRKDIKAHHGNSMLRFIDSFLEDFGPGYPTRGIVAEQAIAAVNRRFAASVLGLKGTIGTKQLVSWFAMADGIPTLDFMASHAEFFKGRKAAKEIVSFLWENSPALRKRGSSLDFELAKIGSLEEPVFRWKHSQRMQDLFFVMIRMGDRVPIYAGGWAVYQHARKQGKTKQQAIEVFEDAMESTQQSTDIDKMSAMQRAGALGRTLTMFMTARMALLRGELRAWRQRPAGLGGTDKITYREFGRRMAVYHFIMPMFIQFIASGLRWETDRQLIAGTLGQLNSFVIFGDILVWAATKVVSEDPEAWKSADLPLAQISKEMMEGASAAFEEDTRIDDMLEVLLELGDVLGQFLGQPVDQVRNIMGGVDDVVRKGEVEKGLKRIWGLSEKVAKESADEPVFPD